MKRLQEAISQSFAKADEVKPETSINLEEAKKLVASLRTSHRARRRHGSETIFNTKVIDSAKRTMKKFKGHK